MSGAQTSGFPNVLFNAPAAYNAAQQYQDNQLLMQQHQQAVTDHDIAAVGQAAAPLLGMSEDDAAKAYPGWLQDMQSRGLAKYAPPTYPGHATTAALVQRAMPLMDQYKMGLMTSPGTQAILDRVFGTGGSTTGSTGTTTSSAATTGSTGGTVADAGALRDQLVSTLGVSPVDAGAILSNFHAESGLNAGINEIHPVIPGSRGGYGLAQWTGPRRDALEAFAQQNKLDVSQPATQLAFMKQELQQPEYAGVLKAMQAAQTPEEKAAVFFHGYLSGNAPSLEHNLPGHVARARAYAGLPAAQVSAAPPGQPTAPGVVMGDVSRPDLAPPSPGGAPGAYPAMGAGVGAVVGQGVRPNIGGPVQTVALPPVIRAQPIPAGRTTVGSNADIMMGGMQQAQAMPLAGTQVAGPPMVASTNPTAPVAAPSVEAPPQPGWGSTIGSYGPQNTLAPTPPPAPAQPVAAAPVPQQPPAAAPSVATGVNSPQFQLAQQKLRQAAAIAAMPGYAYNPQLQAAAAYLKEQAAAYAQADSVVQGPGGVQIHTLTGKQDDPAKPLPHYVYDPTQHAYIDTTGTNKPEFEPAQRDSAVAQRDVMELGPKVANGTATPQEQARYATAVETYRQPELRENPVTKETVRVNKRELPAGFPEPTGLRGTGASGGPATAGGSNVVIPGYSPAQQEIERDPAKYKVSETQYTNDAQDVRPLAEAGRQAQADQVRIKEMQDVLQRFSTGFGTEARTAASAFFQRWLPSALTGWEKTDPNLSGSDAAQAFSKLALVGAGTQERGVLGARGGYQAIKLFKDANPSINLQDATNKSILDMQLISNQANQDYTQAALSHFADNEKKFAATHQYDSLTQFDRNWNAQRNPQVYAAAMGAVSGQPASQWTKGLSDDEYKRALDIVSRANPSATVNGKSGPLSMQPNQTQSGGAVVVQSPADAQRLAPGTPYQTPDGRRFVR